MSTPTNNQLVEWIDAIYMHGVNLSVWEEKFIQDMQEKVERYGDKVLFTPAQTEQIERIYSERTP